MTEIPEHLRKRAEEARKKAEAAERPPAGAPPRRRRRRGRRAAAPSEAESRIPAHLLERSKAAKATRRGRRRRRRGASGGGGTAVATAAPAAGRRHRRRRPAAGRRPRRSHPAPAHRRQVRLDPGRQGGAGRQGPRLAPPARRRVRRRCSRARAFLLVFSIVVNAPLLTLANINQTPNPSKAPWYFLGLQELLTMFHPMVAGVTIPGIGLFALILAPVHRPQPVQQARGPQVRHLACMTVHLMFWAVLVMIGSFFRGPGFNFVFPWREGLFFDL